MCIFLGEESITFIRFSGELMTQTEIRLMGATLYKFMRKRKERREGSREGKKGELEKRPCF